MKTGQQASVLLLGGLVLGMISIMAFASPLQETRAAWSAGSLGLTSNARGLAAHGSADAAFSHDVSLSSTLFDSPLPGLCGDVAPSGECDGVVNVADATLLLNYVGHPGDYSLCCEACGDVSPSGGCDGVIDVGDFILLLNYVLHPGEYQLCCEAEGAATGALP
ncbi:MAG: dockerin type I repeat-containing protein [Anaerolineae bacterium]